MTRRSFTVRTHTTNRGDTFVTRTSTNRWLILIEDQGEIVRLSVDISSKSCPKEWLAERGYTLEVDALAQILR